MCKPAYCANADCKKKTWWGCGQHIPSVMSNVAEEEACKCEPHNALTPGTEPQGGAPYKW